MTEATRRHTRGRSFSRSNCTARAEMMRWSALRFASASSAFRQVGKKHHSARTQNDRGARAGKIVYATDTEQQKYDMSYSNHLPNAGGIACPETQLWQWSQENSVYFRMQTLL